MTQWIDAKEWLPDENIDVLVRTDSRMVTAFLIYEEGEYIWYMPIPTGMAEQLINPIKYVTHWTLLPQFIKGS